MLVLVAKFKGQGKVRGEVSGAPMCIDCYLQSVTTWFRGKSGVPQLLPSALIVVTL